MMEIRRCIVVGASAGGVEALRELVASLPEKLPAAIFVVLHVPPYVASSLPTILSEAGPLTAVHPEDGAPIMPGVIYVAPPDHHLLVDRNRIAVKKGPKENRFRPSIDALFRSAAYIYGHRAIGVILSGALDDGTSGLWSVKRMGGISIVQQPTEARFESMPRSALEQVEIDYRESASQIGPLLALLVGMKEVRADLAHEQEVSERMAKEVSFAAEDEAFQHGVMQLGKLTPFTCPECHGVLVNIIEGKLSRFRCHTGHAYTDSALLEAVMDTTGQMLWQVIRSFEEASILLRHMGRQFEEQGDSSRAKPFLDKASEIEKRSRTFHDVTLEHESLSGDNLGQAKPLNTKSSE
jgi:two-component system, chemotaxis family, protein-glutamate methylesterase/glutaminase